MKDRERIPVGALVFCSKTKKLLAAGFLIKLCATHWAKAGPVNEPIV